MKFKGKAAGSFTPQKKISQLIRGAPGLLQLMMEYIPLPASSFYSWPVYGGFILNCARALNLPVCSMIKAGQSLSLGLTSQMRAEPKTWKR